MVNGTSLWVQEGKKAREEASGSSKRGKRERGAWERSCLFFFLSLRYTTWEADA